MRESLEFYNQFDKKLINDYVSGNRRIVKAIRSLSQFIPSDSDNILEIGCGLGWSSHEFAKSFPEARVLGIDLSPVLIETASKLFGDKNNLKFKSYDLTKGLPSDSFNAILMIDVYEHIPLSDRENFHRDIKKILSKNGCLILACPSKFHQEYLKTNKPSGLQPVDEDVDYDTINKIANDIEGEVTYFEYQNIWNNYDYLYAVIEMNPIYGNTFKGLNPNSILLEPKEERRQRVITKLGVTMQSKKESKRMIGLKAVLQRISKKLN